jgi:hypothetical protein
MLNNTFAVDLDSKKEVLNTLPLINIKNPVFPTDFLHLHALSTTLGRFEMRVKMKYTD